jgi:UDP-sulfoquinovose synthase
MRIAVLGGDGFVGWPTVLHLSDLGHEIHILDNLSRRWIDTELGVQSLTPMDSIQERCRIWKDVTGRALQFHLLDLAHEYERLRGWLAEYRPDAIIHFAEQRAAPYSMKTDRHKVYTVNNNTSATHNLLAAMVETGLSRRRDREPRGRAEGTRDSLSDPPGVSLSHDQITRSDPVPVLRSE